MEEVNEKVHFLGKRHGSFDIGVSLLVLTFFFLTGHAKDDVCHTKECDDAANLFLKNMDRTADPCDDFYQYACGNFTKNATIPSDALRTDYAQILQDEIYQKLNQTLRTDITEQDEKPLRFMKNFYQVCMDSEKDYNTDIKEIAKNINSLGGWPTLHGHLEMVWNDLHFDWLQMTQKLQQLGYLSYCFLRVTLTIDNYIGIFPDTEQLFDGIPKFMNLAGVEKLVADKDLSELMKLRSDLDKVIDSGRGHGQQMTIRQLQERIPEINWLEYIKASGPFTINENQEIYVDDLNYISNLKEILAKQSERTIANYILSKFANIWNSYVNREGLKFQYPDRMWKKCIEEVERNFGIAISSLYARKYFQEINIENKYQDIQQINDVRDIFTHVKKQFVDMFQKSSWMGSEFKSHVVAKLDALRPFIAYPKELLDDQKINEYYSGLKISEHSYFGILSRLRKFNYDKLNEISHKRNWATHANFIQVNAGNMDGRSILIPAGMMHGVFFNKDRPKYMNYGALGNTIGHELGHTFDPSLLILDQYGTKSIFMENSPSYTDYKKRVKCIIEMYNNYTVKGIGEKVNGVLTVGENFADIVGLNAAYNAYKQWVEDHGEEKKLPKIDRSTKQLFWLSAANAYCTKYDFKNVRTAIMTDKHAPAEARIINPFKNMPEFAEDYKCPPGSKMNPIKRCPVF